MNGTGLSRGTVLSAIQKLDRLEALWIDRSRDIHAYSIPLVAHLFGLVQKPDIQNLDHGISEIDKRFTTTEITEKEKKEISEISGQQLSLFEPPAIAKPVVQQIPSPPAVIPATSQDPELAAIDLMLDQYRQFIRGKRPVNVAQRILDACRSYGRTGFQAAARLEDGLQWAVKHRDSPPRYWEWCCTVVTNWLHAEAVSDKQQDAAERMEAAVQRGKVAMINDAVRELPFAYDPADYHPEVRDEFRARFRAAGLR